MQRVDIVSLNFPNVIDITYKALVLPLSPDVYAYLLIANLVTTFNWFGSFARTNNLWPDLITSWVSVGFHFFMCLAPRILAKSCKIWANWTLTSNLILTYFYANSSTCAFKCLLFYICIILLALEFRWERDCTS